MGFFDGTNDVKPLGQDTRIKAGRYPALRIVSCALKDTHYGRKYIVEAEVVAPPIETEPGVTPNPMGSVVSITSNMDGSVEQQYGYGKRERKSFIMAVLNQSEDADAQGPPESSLFGELNGKTFGLTATVRTAKTGNKFIKVFYFPATDPAHEDPETAPGGPWFPLPEGDTRGTHYNADNEIRSF